MHDENEQQSPEEKAFQDVAIGYEFKGHPLYAWAGSREIAAQAMGMKAPAFNDTDRAAIGEGHIYPGGLRDAIICLWICSTPNASELAREETEERKREKPRQQYRKEWTVQRAGNNPAAAYDEAEKWATAQGITGTASEAFAEAYKTMFAILTGVSVSQFEVKVEGGESGDAQPGKY